MKEEYSNQEKEIIDALQSIKDVPDRQQSQITRGKAAFLAEAKEIADQSSAHPVSISLFQRLINSFTQPKPQMRLSTLTASIIFVSVLLVTFSGSVYAARYSLPNQTLYPYKLWLEDRRLSVTSKTDSQIDLHLAFADERLREVQELGLDLDDPLVGRVFENYSGHVEDANRLLVDDDEHDGHLDELKDLEDRYEKLFDRDDDEDEDVKTPADVDEADFNEDEDSNSEDQQEDDEKEDKKSEKESSKKKDKPGESSSDDDDEDSETDDPGESDESDEPDSDDEPDDEKDDEPDDPEKTPEPDEPDDEKNDEVDP